MNSITLNSGLQTIGEGAFDECAITSIEIPSTVTSIGVNPVSHNNKLTSITVAAGNTVYYSGDSNAIIETATNNLIAGCKNTVIPATTKTIGTGAFQGAGIAGAVSIPEGVTTVGFYAFRSNDISTLEIPASLEVIYQGALENSFNLVSVAAGNKRYESMDNCIIEKDIKRLIAAGKNVSSIPSGVKNIGAGAFAYSSITSIEIPASVTQISAEAFCQCYDLSSVVLNEGLVNIETRAFVYCQALHEITIPTSVTSIGENAFNYTGYLTSSNKEFTLYIPYTLNINASSNVFGSPKYATVIPYVKPAKEYTSFACPQDVDFSGATGLKAYVASGFDASAKKVSLKEVTSAKAGEGIIIQATAGTKYDLALATASDNGTNLLVGVTADTAIEPTDGSNTNFLLSDGQFLKAQAGTLANGKAYLQLPTSATARAKSLGITTEGDVTGIINIDLDEEGDGMIYDLNGRRISETATKGIYVKNGKKVIIK